MFRRLLQARLNSKTKSRESGFLLPKTAVKVIHSCYLHTIHTGVYFEM